MNLREVPSIALGNAAKDLGSVREGSGEGHWECQLWTSHNTKCFSLHKLFCWVDRTIGLKVAPARSQGTVMLKADPRGSGFSACLPSPGACRKGLACSLQGLHPPVLLSLSLGQKVPSRAGGGVAAAGRER